MKYPWLAPVWTEYAERLESGRMAHAILLSGPEGTGKLELARDIVASLLCLGSGPAACGTCRSCQLLQSGAHPERHVLTFETKNNSNELRTELVIDQIRRLIESLQLTNTISRRKVALLHPAEALNRNAANALLKTLEEPPGDAVLMLVAHDASRLPATIRSRCQKLWVRSAAPEIALQWLGEQSKAEAAEIRAALEAAAGRPLRALAILQEGRAQQYRLVDEVLDRLSRQELASAEATSALAEIEPRELWSWLSLQAARHLKLRPADRERARQLARLQSLADANRQLLATPVRKDLLLQDWLIQWGRMAA